MQYQLKNRLFGGLLEVELFMKRYYVVGQSYPLSTKEYGKQLRWRQQQRVNDEDIGFAVIGVSPLQTEQ